jgi:hypothetical protein
VGKHALTRVPQTDPSSTRRELVRGGAQATIRPERASAATASIIDRRGNPAQRFGFVMFAVTALVAALFVSPEPTAYATAMSAEWRPQAQSLEVSTLASAEVVRDEYTYSEPEPEPVPVAAAPVAGSSSGSGVAPVAGTPDPGSAKSIAAEMVAARGWGTDQYDCLVSLWNKESGWNVYAHNASSGAYGIPQALPGNKMSSVGADWATNAATQITWGLGYISGRYGTPCGAWAKSQASGWY